MPLLVLSYFVIIPNFFYCCYSFKKVCYWRLIFSVIILVSYLKSFFNNCTRNRLLIPLNFWKGRSSKYGKLHTEVWSEISKVQIPTLVFMSHVRLGQVPRQCCTWFLWWNGDKSSYLTGLFWYLIYSKLCILNRAWHITNTQMLALRNLFYAVV